MLFYKQPKLFIQNSANTWCNMGSGASTTSDYSTTCKDGNEDTGVSCHHGDYDAAGYLTTCENGGLTSETNCATQGSAGATTAFTAGCQIGNSADSCDGGSSG